MYIPSPQRQLPDSVAQGRFERAAEVGSHGFHFESVSALCRLVLGHFRTHLYTDIGSQDLGIVKKRQFSSDQGRNTNIKIGIIVAFLIPAFLAVICAFLYVYRGSIYCFKAKRRRRRHHHRHKSISSKGSRGSDRGAPPPAPPPPPPDDAPPPPEPPPPDK